MGLAARLLQAEGRLGDALLWREVQALALETSQPAEQLLLKANQMVDPYWHLARPGPSGSLDIEPALRAIAEGEGLQYEELAAEVRRTLKQWRRRQLRHMRNER